MSLLLLLQRCPNLLYSSSVALPFHFVVSHRMLCAFALTHMDVAAYFAFLSIYSIRIWGIVDAGHTAGADEIETRGAAMLEGECTGNPN